MGVNKIKWLCDRCGESFSDKSGFIGVKAKEITAARRAREHHEAEFEVTDSRGFVVMPVKAPPRARWHCLHDKCIEEGEVFDYWLSGEKITDPVRLLLYWAEKPNTFWMRDTDWPSFILHHVRRGCSH